MSWRTIPVAILAVLGGLLALFGHTIVALMAFTACTGRPLYEPGPSGFSQRGVVVGLWNIAFGGCLIAASRFWSAGRWRVALLFIALGIALTQTLNALGLMPV